MLLKSDKTPDGYEQDDEESESADELAKGIMRCSHFAV